MPVRGSIKYSCKMLQDCDLFYVVFYGVFLNACEHREPVESPDSAEVPVQQGQGSLAHTRRMSKVGAACSMCCTVG